MNDDEVIINDPLVPIPEGEGTIKLHLKYGGSAMTTKVLGIAPGPQKIETLLDAFEQLVHNTARDDRQIRQYRAFRTRILRMFEELEEEIEYLVEYGNR